MKMIVVVLAAAFCVSVVLSCKRPCVNDFDCRRDECCALGFTGQTMECREMAERVGEACGAPYLCSKCYRNLTCVTITDPKLETSYSLRLEKVDDSSSEMFDPQLMTFLEETNKANQETSTCPHPASSTCQNISATPSDMFTASEAFKPEPMVEELSSHEEL